MPFGNESKKDERKYGSDRDKSITEFDPDLPWNNPQNIMAARVRGLRYDSGRQVYIDADGCPITDSFGQDI